MTPELRQSIVTARSGDYNTIMRTTIFGFIAVAATVHFAPHAFSLPLFVLTVTLTIYGILAGGAALDDIDTLRADMTPKIAETSYGTAVGERNFPMLKLVSSGVIGISGLALLLAILI